VAGQFLCEVCFDALTNHMTAAWNGVDTAVCDDCLAPPAEHVCWQELGEAYGGVELHRDEWEQGYLVRLRNGATVHFRWGRPPTVAPDQVGHPGAIPMLSAAGKDTEDSHASIHPSLSDIAYRSLCP
jgi:hypothetical protein